MLEKKEFLRYIDEIKKAIKFQDEINDVCNKYGYFTISDYPDCIDLSVRLLEHLMGLDPDFDYGTDISYFIFELDFGENWKPGMLICDGKDIDLSTAEKLYDFIMEGEQK